jgi:hypothetical protein
MWKYGLLRIHPFCNFFKPWTTFIQDFNYVKLPWTKKKKLKEGKKTWCWKCRYTQTDRICTNYSICRPDPQSKFSGSNIRYPTKPKSASIPSQLIFASFHYLTCLSVLSRPVKVLTGPTLRTTPHRSTVIPSIRITVCHFYFCAR